MSRYLHSKIFCFSKVWICSETFIVKHFVKGLDVCKINIAEHFPIHIGHQREDTFPLISELLKYAEEDTHIE